MAKDPFFVLVHYGEVQHVSTEIEEVIEHARDAVEEHLSTFYGPRPFKITQSDIDHIDLVVHKLAQENSLPLPYQEWADEYYQERERELLNAEEREYQRYLCLRNKWESRRLTEVPPKTGIDPPDQP